MHQASPRRLKAGWIAAQNMLRLPWFEDGLFVGRQLPDRGGLVGVGGRLIEIRAGLVAVRAGLIAI
jgi:hypothetical protein